MEFEGYDMQTITICGSMRFEKEMQKIAFKLEGKAQIHCAMHLWIEKR